MPFIPKGSAHSSLEFLLNIYLLIGDSISHSLVWPQTCYVTKDDLESWSSCLRALALRLQACTTTSSLCHCGDGTQRGPLSSKLQSPAGHFECLENVLPSAFPTLSFGGEALSCGLVPSSLLYFSPAAFMAFFSLPGIHLPPPPHCWAYKCTTTQSNFSMPVLGIEFMS